MRKGIDHIGVGVVFYCHDGYGNFLMSKRSSNSRDEIGRWDPGGGGIELGEHVVDTLKREIKEEYCTTIKKIEFLGYRDVHRVDHNGNKTHWISLDFKVLVDPKKVKNGVPDKHTDIGWFRLDKLPKSLHSQMSTFVKLYKKKLLE